MPKTFKMLPKSRIFAKYGHSVSYLQQKTHDENFSPNECLTRIYWARKHNSWNFILFK